MSFPIPPTGGRTQTGFSLVEILVGLVIGLLASLVIMQVFSVFEGQKRATTGSADAQINGSIALYNIKRDAESAGFGLPVFSSQNTPLKCTTLPTFDHDGDAATAVIDLFPVVITDGGGGLSDTIAIRYGRTSMGGIPSLATVAGTTATFTTNNNMGCQADDWAIISSGTTCAMAQVAATLLSPATRTDWATMPLTGTPAVLSGSIACIGKYKKDSPYDDHSSPLEYLYWVDNGNLVQGGNPSATGSGAPIVAGIVHEDHFEWPSHRAQRRRQFIHQRPDAFRLVEDGDDHGQFRRGARLFHGRSPHDTAAPPARRAVARSRLFSQAD